MTAFFRKKTAGATATSHTEILGQPPISSSLSWMGVCLRGYVLERTIGSKRHSSATALLYWSGRFSAMGCPASSKSTRWIAACMKSCAAIQLTIRQIQTSQAVKAWGCLRD